jgi:hypothetical protein
MILVCLLLADYLAVPSVTKSIYHWLIGQEGIINYKGWGRKQLRPNLRHYTDICLKELRKTSPDSHWLLTGTSWKQVRMVTFGPAVTNNTASLTLEPLQCCLLSNPSCIPQWFLFLLCALENAAQVKWLSTSSHGSALVTETFSFQLLKISAVQTAMHVWVATL